MKKNLFLLAIVSLITLSACTSSVTMTDPGGETVTTSATESILATVPIASAVGEGTLSNAQLPSFEVSTTREFDVLSGVHGYIGVALIEHMNDYLPNRLAFSDREHETAEWIVATLLEMGFDNAQIEVQSFDVETETSSWWGSAMRMISWFEDAGYYDEVEFTGNSQNVILTLPGRTSQTIILGAHYDGMANPGVSDNASGTVLLLENAYRMQHVNHYYTLQYVFFGAEEVGLIGAFYFTDQMSNEDIDNLVLMINADVIMDGPDLVFAIGNSDESFGVISQNEVTETVKGIASILNANEGTDLISKPHALFLPSDQLAFLRFDSPVMVFYATHPVVYPEVFIGDVLHTPDDNLDFIMRYHPGRIERALRDFGLFLERITSSESLQQ